MDSSILHKTLLRRRLSAFQSKRAYRQRASGLPSHDDPLALSLHNRGIFPKRGSHDPTSRPDSITRVAMGEVVDKG